MIIITIKPKHFRTATYYVDNKNCPLAMALKEHFKTDDIDVSPAFCTISRKNYKTGWMSDTVATKEEPNLCVDDVIKRAKQKKKVGSYTVILTEYN